MFQSEELDKHLKSSHTIETESLVFAEWNLNDSSNIERIGNYRYRPGTTDNPYSTITSTYDRFDDALQFPFYTGATDSDITIESGFDNQDQPTLFTTQKEKMTLLYSLEDCIKPHRPRSGINKLLYLGENASQYLDVGGREEQSQEVLDIARRPRYYMSSRSDYFKYWTSYRTESAEENGIPVQREYGISRTGTSDVYYIYDAAPFVVYKESVAANRIVIKMQTNVGDIDLGPFRVGQQEIPDPLYGDANKTTPIRWWVEVLKDDNWQRVISFDETSVDENGDPIIKSDGYVELQYGLTVPDFYEQSMVYAGELPNTSLLPEVAPYGYTFLVKENDDDRGMLYFFNGSTWTQVPPAYGWSLGSRTFDSKTPVVTQPVDPDYFFNEVGDIQYREIDFIRGIRVVAQTMNKPECTFDLIEFSPRIVLDLTDKTSTFSVTKTMSDLGNGTVPVGNLLAATGSIDIFDTDFAFNPNNLFNEETRTGSIMAKHIDKRSKFTFYQIVKNVEDFNYYIPIKTMYSDEIPAVSSSTGIISFSLRDLFFLLESSKAPEILITDASISYAVSILLDNIGFSNYAFRRVNGVPETIIPFFFTGSDLNVAQVLQQLAVASQTAMFFDEYNNLIIMSKEYLLPNSEEERPTDTYLCGQDSLLTTDGDIYRYLGSVSSDSSFAEIPEDLGAYLNTGNNGVYTYNKEFEKWLEVGKLDTIIYSNILNIASEDRRVYNEGNITYTTRYIQRSISKYSQAPYVDKFKTYGYKPSLLWEVSGRESLRSQNEPPQQSQGFTLSAVPLNTTLSDALPIVVNNQIVNNIIDLGDAIDNVSSYEGYFYANGEIIRYDAMEYAVTGSGELDTDQNVVWITSNQEYQRYFSKLPFNGKMYATGNLRIFAEPEYEDDNGFVRMKSGAVKRHGRGQFGTPVTIHQSGLDPYWTENTTVKGCLQKATDYLFVNDELITYPELFTGTAGKVDESIPGIVRFDSDVLSQQSNRGGLIKNFRYNKYFTENESNNFNTSRTGTLQSSALVFNGPVVPSEVKTADFVSYVYKNLSEPFKHFGTRMRIIGKIESTNQKSQTPFGAFPIYDVQNLNVDDPSKNVQILGGSGGIAFNLNRETNNGYYFEIVSLTQDNIDQYNGAIKEKPFVYNLSRTTLPTATNNIVTVITDTEVKFNVGERVTISGLVDAAFPENTRTPLNGEYQVVEIGTDKKSFKYQIATPSQTALDIVTASGNGTRVTYVVTAEDSRKTLIQPGDKISVSANTQGSLNLQNVIVDSFRQIAGEATWELTVLSTATGSGIGGSMDYVPLTTTSKTGGVATIASQGTTTVSNIYFYKVLSNNKGNTIQAYSSSGGTLRIILSNPSTYAVNDRIIIDGIEEIDGEYTVISAVGNSISVASPIGNTPLQEMVYAGTAPTNIYLKHGEAIPYKLWSGTGNILTDDGKFTGQYRFLGEDNPTVFDLAAEYVNIGESRRFYLYLNGKQIATVTDETPIPEYNDMALFVRGSSQCMFENVYALGVNVAQNSRVSLRTPISKIFGDEEIDASESLRKYALSGVIQKTYLSGIGSQEPPSHLLYYEEFGTIMREAAYLNIKYDRSYPALYAKVMKTLNRLKSYVVSGFYAGSYGADFLIFNCLDTNINLDDTTGNFLRIQGITFTQNTTKTLTVDDYYRITTSFRDPIVSQDQTLVSPYLKKEEYNQIVNSRTKYGQNEFTVESQYIQTDEAAREVFGWLLSKMSKQKLLVGMNSFAMLNLQLGDIVRISYTNNDGIDVIAPSDKRFVVYNMECSKESGDENMTIYLAEV